MSVQATSWVWESSTTTGVMRLVLLAIADGANREGERSCQSAKTLARMAAASERTVWRCIRELEESGVIEKTGVDGFYQTSVYTIKGMTSRQGDDMSPPDNTTPIVLPNEGVVVPPIGTQPHKTPKDNPSIKRASQIAEDWNPSQSLLKWTAENFPTVDPAYQRDKFVDHHLAKGSLMKSWDAAWRTWVRNSITFNTPRASGNRSTDRMMNNFQLLQGWQASAPAGDPFAQKALGQ